MGFSAIEGLPMATRCGAIDPDILLFLHKARNHSITDIETLLCSKIGLLGMSGISGDMRMLTNSEARAAAAAIECLVYRILKFVGAYTAVLGGLDALVFTAGIGENDCRCAPPSSRSLSWLGVKFDENSNDRNGPRFWMCRLASLMLPPYLFTFHNRTAKDMTAPSGAKIRTSG